MCGRHIRALAAAKIFKDVLLVVFQLYQTESQLRLLVTFSGLFHLYRLFWGGLDKYMEREFMTC